MAKPFTSERYRKEIRKLVEADTITGRLPLRKRELHTAYYALTGEKLDTPSKGEVTLALIGELDGVTRDPWDAGQPLVKAELKALFDALEAAAADADEVLATDGGEIEVADQPRHQLDPDAEAMTGRFALVTLPADADSPTDHHVRNFMESEAAAWEQAQLAVSGDEPIAAMAWVMEVRGAMVQSAQDHLDHGVSADDYAAPESIMLPLEHALGGDTE